MGDTLICPRIIWKVDLSCLTSVSRSYCQSVYIFKSHWKLLIEIDNEWEEYKIYIMPENPEVYMNVRFLVQCGVRDNYGTLRFECLHSTSTGNLLMCSIWRANRKLLLEENMIQNNLLWVIVTVEPESRWEDCQTLTYSSEVPGPHVSMPCVDDLISNLKHLHIHSLNHDVLLECEDKTIKAHKNILSCRSPMFEGMFRNDTKEALEGKAVIHGTPFDIFEKLIHYLYTTEINLESIDFACKIYVEADKFLLVSLKERCKIFFKAYLCVSCPRSELGNRVSDACKVLCLANERADIHLKCWIEDYLADSALLVTEEWYEFVENHMDLALEVYFKLLCKVKLGKTSSI